MSKKDYTKFSNQQVNDREKFVKTEEPIEVAPEVVEEIVEEKDEPRYATGIVGNCECLNVRKEPRVDATVLCVIPNSAEVQIDMLNSTEEFYKVCTTAGVEGFCMKKFIRADA